jgi:galactose-1-phosphate uridylyltransferase
MVILLPRFVTNPVRTQDVLDIVVVKEFVLPMHLTMCRTLSSKHLRALVDTASSFQKPLKDTNFTRMYWAAFEACLEEMLLGEFPRKRTRFTNTS